jgi:lipoprotein-anchoring transpeptidase ErfK/SrfK
VLKKSILRPIRTMAAGFRMAVTAALVALLPAACASTAEQSASGTPPVTSMYAAMPNERFPIPAIETGRIAPKYLRRVVNYRTTERPGTIVVDTPDKFLYLVLGDGKAMRYGIGVGREGYSWAGKARVGAKRSWPTWTPPAEMIDRQPELEKYRNGQAPGLGNPLGARALYIFEGNRDTLYRLHGTNEPWSIGKAVSSGCIRLFNQDIIDLYGRVPVGAPIVVIPDHNTIIG